MANKNTADKEAEIKESVAANADDQAPSVDGPVEKADTVESLAEQIADLHRSNAELNAELTAQRQASESQSAKASRNVEPTSSGNIQPDDLPAEPILVAARDELVVSEGGRNPFALIPRVSTVEKVQKGN